MFSIDPKENAESYKLENQKKSNEGFSLEDGTYTVVNLTVQRQFVGQKGTPKLVFRTMILGVTEGADKTVEELEHAVGKTFFLDMWATQKNAERLKNLARAHGFRDHLDGDDDEALVRAFTGVPYEIKLKVKERGYTDRAGQKRTAQDIQVDYTYHLPKDKRERYLEDPDVRKQIKPYPERLIETKTYGGSKPDPQGDQLDSDGAFDDDFGF